jgi:hypothetical protein
MSPVDNVAVDRYDALLMIKRVWYASHMNAFKDLINEPIDTLDTFVTILIEHVEDSLR